MKKSEFIELVAEKAETTKAAATRVVDAIFDTTSGAIAEAVKAGQEVSIPGFGKFKPKTRPARKGRNPQTGAEIQIPERSVVSFSTGKALRENLESKPSTKRAGGSGGGASKRAGGAKGATGAKNVTAKGGTGAKSSTAAKNTAAKSTTAAKNTGGATSGSKGKSGGAGEGRQPGKRK